MLSDADRARIRADFVDIRKDSETMIALKRGGTTLAAQSFRVAMLSSFQRQNEAPMSTSAAPMTLLGAVDADIAIGDRFSIDGQSYTVMNVRPNNFAGRMAEAELRT